MKSNSLIGAYMGSILIIALTLPAFGQKQNKDVKSVCIQASMTCMGCKNTIEKNIGFEKGVKAVKADLDTKLVHIEYVEGKNSPEKLAEAIRELGYDATVVDDEKCSGIKE